MYRKPRIKSTKLKKGPSEDASIPLGRKKKAAIEEMEKEGLG